MTVEPTLADLQIGAGAVTTVTSCLLQYTSGDPVQTQIINDTVNELTEAQAKAALSAAAGTLAAAIRWIAKRDGLDVLDAWSRIATLITVQAANFPIDKTGGAQSE